MRPDVWFFGDMPSYCSLDPNKISFPVGVIVCPYAPCINDHMAFMPRRLAPAYFNINNDFADCAGLRNMTAHWKNYNVWRLMQQGVPLAEPSPLVPYTLIRPCAHDARTFFPECQRWSDRPFKKNAGLTHYANGSALPGEVAYRERERQAFALCHQRALEVFPAYKILAAVNDHGGTKHCSRVDTLGSLHRKNVPWKICTARMPKMTKNISITTETLAIAPMESATAAVGKTKLHQPI